jgi:hypothetical protein
LRLVPPPFLCAICGHLFFPAGRRFFNRLAFLRSWWQYLVYRQAGEKLAVSVLAAVADLGLKLEDDNLLVLAVPLRRSQHPRSLNNRLADRYLVAIGDKQYTVQFNVTAFSRIQSPDIYGLTFGYFILFAAGFNNSVNFEPPK